VGRKEVDFDFRSIATPHAISVLSVAMSAPQQRKRDFLHKVRDARSTIVHYGGD
jgi:hypothetical protein